MADPVDAKILSTIKLALGLQEDYPPFDAELTMHINSAIATLNQLGVGPRVGLVVDADTKWSALLEGKTDLENAKTFIQMNVKILFDGNAMTQHVIAAYQKMIDETAERLVMAADPMIPQTLPSSLEDELEV